MPKPQIEVVLYDARGNEVERETLSVAKAAAKAAEFVRLQGGPDPEANDGRGQRGSIEFIPVVEDEEDLGPALNRRQMKLLNDRLHGVR